MLRYVILLTCILGATWSYTVERITEPLLLGEGPHWNALTGLLYFVDITNSTIHVYDPLTGDHNYTYVDGGTVSFIIPVAETTDEFIVSTGLDIRHVKWDGHQDSVIESTILFSEVQDSDGSRFNDAKVDRSGNLWAGTMGPEIVPNTVVNRTGKLYHVTRYVNSITTQLENVLISNGLAWSVDGSVMYYTDTGDNTIDSFDFDASSENPLSNRQRIYNFTKNGITGKTDGFTIDVDGNLWLACYSGYQVIAINPNNGTLLMSIPINASQVTSVTWGGADLDQLYVTTAQKDLSDEEWEDCPYSGATFVITGLNTRGIAGDSYVMYSSSSSLSSGNAFVMFRLLWLLITLILAFD